MNNYKGFTSAHFDELKKHQWASSVMLFMADGCWSQPHRELWDYIVPFLAEFTTSKGTLEKVPLLKSGTELELVPFLRNFTHTGCKCYICTEKVSITCCYCK